MRNAPAGAPVTTTVAALSDHLLLQRIKELSAVEHHIEAVVSDHLREIERRRLFLTLGCSSMFDYAVRELGYSTGAAWRRLKAMRLCAEVQGARVRLQEGTLTLDAAAQLQHAFERQRRKQSQGGGGSCARSGAGSGRATPTMTPEAERPAAPVLDLAARESLVAQAAGKSTRQVQEMLAEVDPDLAAPTDRMRPLGAGRWELKAVVDDDCQRGLEQLKGLLSHVDPQMTTGNCWDGWCRKRWTAMTRRGRRVGGAEVAGARKLRAQLRRRRTPPPRHRQEPGVRRTLRLRGGRRRPPPGLRRLPAQLRRRRTRPGRIPRQPPEPPLRRRKWEAARRGKPRRRLRGRCGAPLPGRRHCSPGYAAAPFRRRSGGRSGSVIGAAAATWMKAVVAAAAPAICWR